MCLTIIIKPAQKPHFLTATKAPALRQFINIMSYHCIDTLVDLKLIQAIFICKSSKSEPKEYIPQSTRIL